MRNLVKNHPELTQKDTLRFTDTVITNSVETDTIVTYQALKDTVVLVKDNLTVKVFHYRDSIFISGSVNPDTIIKIKEVPVDRIIIKESEQKKIPDWLKAVYVFAGLLVMGFILEILRYFKKENKD